MASIQCEITAEDVIDLMNEDDHFAYEMWKEIATVFDAGLLSDNFIDMIGALKHGGERSKKEAEYILFMMTDVTLRARRLHFPPDDSNQATQEATND